MALVIADDITRHDIIRVPNSPDFIQSGKNPVFALVRDVVPDSLMPSTVGRYVVFEIAENNGRLRSGTPFMPLDAENVTSYGLPGSKQWGIVIDPVEIKVNEYNYHADRTGHLQEPDESNLSARIIDMGGQEHIYRQGDGPQGFRTQTREANLASSAGFSQKFIGTEDEEAMAAERREARKKFSGRKRIRDGYESHVVDLPIGFAGKVMSLDPAIIALLQKQGITSMRDANNIASQPDLAAAFFPATTGSVPEISIDDAINAGYLPENAFWLEYATKPIQAYSKPVATLNELVDLIRNDDGAGLKDYTGLASKGAKARLKLTEATESAWKAYTAALPAAGEQTQGIASKIKSAWQTLMNEYRNNVLPHIGPIKQGGQILNASKIPAKFIDENGGLVFTFPKITP